MTQYNVTGMSCAACSARVEKAVSSIDGVSSCSVNLLTNSMGVEGTATSKEIIEAVEKAGYGASLKTKNKKVKSNSDDYGKQPYCHGTCTNAFCHYYYGDKSKILYQRF